MDRRTLSAMPEWRRPIGTLAGISASLGYLISRERAGLSDALLESMPGTAAELLAAVRDEWSPDATMAQVRTSLMALSRSGEIVRGPDGWEAPSGSGPEVRR
jgi:hypothetical protein